MVAVALAALLVWTSLNSPQVECRVCMVYEGRSEHEIERQARGRSQSIWEDGVRKVLAGQTSVEEVLRVIRAD